MAFRHRGHQRKPAPNFSRFSAFAWVVGRLSRFFQPSASFHRPLSSRAIPRRPHLPNLDFGVGLTTYLGPCLLWSLCSCAFDPIDDTQARTNNVRIHEILPYIRTCIQTDIHTYTRTYILAYAHTTTSCTANDSSTKFTGNIIGSRLREAYERYSAVLGPIVNSTPRLLSTLLGPCLRSVVCEGFVPSLPLVLLWPAPIRAASSLWSTQTKCSHSLNLPYSLSLFQATFPSASRVSVRLLQLCLPLGDRIFFLSCSCCYKPANLHLLLLSPPPSRALESPAPQSAAIVWANPAPGKERGKTISDLSSRAAKVL